MQLNTLSGWFGPGRSGATFTLQLTEDDVRALARNWACLPSELESKLRSLLDASVADAIERGQRGLAADQLAADGSIEVGRPAGFFHSLEGLGDRL